MALQYVKSFFHYVHGNAEKNEVLEMNHYNYCGQCITSLNSCSEATLLKNSYRKS